MSTIELKIKGKKEVSNGPYDHVTNAIHGDMFVATDNDGESWLFVKVEWAEDRYVCIACNDGNYYPGESYTEEDIIEALEGYDSKVEKVRPDQIKVKIDLSK